MITVSARISDGLHAAIDEVARLEDGSISDVLRRTFRDYVTRKAQRALAESQSALSIATMIGKAIDDRNIDLLDTLLASESGRPRETRLERIKAIYADHFAEAERAEAEAESYFRVLKIADGEVDVT